MEQYRKPVITLLRLSLALIFVWFGVLKIFGFNPVYDLIASVSPLLAEGPGLIALGVLETVIGLFLAVNRFRRLTHAVLVLHLAGTFLTFITEPSLMFQPHFPVLTLDGEFVIKNLVLALGGLAVLVNSSEQE